MEVGPGGLVHSDEFDSYSFSIGEWLHPAKILICRWFPMLYIKACDNSGHADDRSPMTDSDASIISNPASPIGVRGWLLFFTLSLVLFTPATYIMLTVRSYYSTLAMLSGISHPYAHDIFYAAEQLTSIALYGYGIFAGIQIWKTRPTAVVHAKRFLLLLVVYHLVDFAVALNMASILDPAGTVQRYLPKAIPRQLRYVVFPIIWYLYLLKSKRVRNTFFLGKAVSNPH